MARGEPYKTFQTEREYREHVGAILGHRLAREQDKTALAEQRAETAEKRCYELAEEVAELRRIVHTGGTSL